MTTETKTTAKILANAILWAIAILTAAHFGASREITTILLPCMALLVQFSCIQTQSRI